MILFSAYTLRAARATAGLPLTSHACFAKQSSVSFAAKKRWALYAIIIALSASSLVAGLLFSDKLGTLDRRYSDAMERNLEAIVLTRNLSRNTAEAHRSLINLAADQLASDSASRRAPSEEASIQIRKLAQMRAANDRLFIALEPLVGDTLAPLLSEVRALRLAYLERAETLLGKLEQGDDTGATTYRTTELRPAFDRFIAAQDRLADAILDRATATSAAISADSRRWQRVSIGLSGWPFGLAAFVVTTMFVALAWVLRSVKEE